MALIWALCFVCLCSVLHGPNLGILFVLFCVLLCRVSLIGVLHGGSVLHGHRVLFLFCTPLCWVSFIGVLHGGFSVAWPLSGQSVLYLVVGPPALGLLHWCTVRGSLCR